MLPASSELEYFLEVSQTLNISRASERLGISQPTLSLAIKRLEENIGVPLLLRGKTGVTLTQAGRRLQNEARAILSNWDDFRQAVTRSEEELTGVYRLGCHVSVGLFSFGHFIPQLLKDHPNLEFQLTHDLSRKIQERIISLELDCGIVVNPIPHPDCVIQRLAEDRVTFYARKGARTELTDLASGEAVLLCEPDLIQTQSITKGLLKAGIKFSRTITSPNLEIITELASKGAGIAILPMRVAKNHPEQGLEEVKHTALNKLFYKDELCMVYRADRIHSKASRRLVREIESRLKKAWTKQTE